MNAVSCQHWWVPEKHSEPTTRNSLQGQTKHSLKHPACRQKKGQLLNTLTILYTYLSQLISWQSLQVGASLFRAVSLRVIKHRPIRFGCSSLWLVAVPCGRFFGASDAFGLVRGANGSNPPMPHRHSEVVSTPGVATLPVHWAAQGRWGPLGSWMWRCSRDGGFSKISPEAF